MDQSNPMQAQLEQLIDLASNKYENTIIIKSKTSDIKMLFPVALDLDQHKTYKVAVKFFSVYNNITNISADVNNEFTFTEPASSSSAASIKTIKLESGAYEIADINNVIQEKTKKAISFVPDMPTGKVKMILKKGYEVDFTGANTFREILGFASKKYAASAAQTQQNLCQRK